MSPDEKLRVYHDLLVKWQKAINLVSNSTLDDAMERHFQDSLQILEHIPETARIVADLGSGGGFPGMIIAQQRPDLAVHLIESDFRKCEFLRAVSRETITDVSIRNERVEDVFPALLPDVITARAFASLEKILGFCQGVFEQNPALELVLLKGRSVRDEIFEAQKAYDFSYELFPSVTGADSFILKIKMG